MSVRLFAVFLMLLIPGFSGGQEINFDSLYNRSIETIDSVQAECAVNLSRLKSEYDSVNLAYANLTRKLQLEIDSLRQVGQPVETLVNRVDSLFAAKEADLYAIKQKSNQVKHRAIEKLRQLNLPPQMSKITRSYIDNLGQVDIALPPNLLRIPSLNAGIWEGENIPAVEWDNLLNTSWQQEIKEGLGRIEEGKASLPALSMPDAEKLAEAAEKGVTTWAEGELGTIPGVPALPASEKEMRQQLIDMAKKQAVNHLGGKQEILQEAMEQLAEYKKKYGEVNRLNELAVEPADPIKDLPFHRRLIHGITIQYQRWQAHLLDLNLYAGYRLDSRWATGIGWNYRLAYDADTRQWSEKSVIAGPRTFADFYLRRGFALHAEAELMRTFIKRNLNDPLSGYWGWVFSALVGLKAEYRISSKIQGTAYFLYNLIDSTPKSAYVNRFNGRLGLQYIIRERSKDKR